MKQQKFNLEEHLQLIPSEPPPKKRARKGRNATWPNDLIKGNTKGLQLELWPYKGKQTSI